MLTLDGHLRRWLDKPGKNYALLTDEPDTAVVFAHGFFGDAETTWMDFPNAIEQDRPLFKIWDRCDLYFYSYESRDQIVPLAEDFHQFLRDVLDPRKFVGNFHTSTVIRSGFRIEQDIEIAPRKYKKLILVGHSTGGVIIRQTILNELRDCIESGSIRESKSGFVDSTTGSSALILNSSVRLFGPAHKGAICSGEMAIAFNVPLVETVAACILRSRPLFHNLKPNNPPLTDIENNTSRYYRKFGQLKALTAISLFGRHDAIVIIGEYTNDPHRDTVEGHYHTTICKPWSGFYRPADFVHDA